MVGNEMERCSVGEYLRAAVIRTGVPSASPMTKGNKPPASASHFIVVKTMTARATRQTKTPRKKVRRRPTASVTQPANRAKTVIAGAQTQPTNAPAASSLNPRPDESHKLSVLLVFE